MMTITLSVEPETRLRREAERTGQDCSSLADALLLDRLTEDPETMAELDFLTDEEIQQIRAGIRRDLEAAEAGRVTPLAAAGSEARQRHGFPSTLQQLHQILTQAFPGMTVELDDPQGPRVHERVVWDGFAGKDQADRQAAVREVLKKELGPRVREVGVLLTYTPTELEAMQAA